MSAQQPYVTIRSRRPADTNGNIDGDSAAAAGSTETHARSATHDISRTSFHVKHISQFAKRLEDSATRAFPNRGRTSQRYSKVQALLLHWGSDDLFVLPELEDLEKCLRDEFAFGTDIFAIPSENSHLELMMRLGQLIKEHESQDTLFIIYYGGHARIDDSRQSTWCATRDADSPWLQWSAIQTLLERSKSDVLILLDCCAGAASATFPNGNSITETISASSWDAIAPDPGRYSFTNALIEVLQEWRLRAFSAAMLHAEVLARLKHPRPIQINGKHFEARSTPVHFMMTANHKAPSIELCRLRPAEKVPAPLPQNHLVLPITGRAPEEPDPMSSGLATSEPNEDTPHVMISLALEDDQRLDINAWEQWLNAFPALAKFVKVQGVFKSHSTLLLVSMPVMVWDLLPEDNAVSFVAFIRSKNLAIRKTEPPPSFLEIAPLDLIERAFPQEHGQEASLKWRDARCLVFYARGLEWPWECPAARIILEKLNADNWSGKCFILKGHYREFSQSFDQYIVGATMTDGAKAWIQGQGLKAVNDADILTSHEQYAGWLSHVESEDRARTISTSPTSTSQRLETLEAQEKELEKEFKAQYGSLFRKAEDLRLSHGEADESFDTKARFVEPLDRGLEKIRGMGAAAMPPIHYAPGHAKVVSEGYFDRAHTEDDVPDDYVESKSRKFGLERSEDPRAQAFGNVNRVGVTASIWNTLAFDFRLLLQVE
ncbi:Rhodanese-like protein [Purpureocillium lilacinum]|uniref:Rhodanese-like protein n=1 Tax=Purpureocillium lilacinum TaxID=33203 RepID=A0A179I0F8_PURLI|nr:Rhodanese-like protein [Purpureocillium lilacinum]OAQ95100.1 Rhodanese-like protein [Purpureocillium lilacinum]